MNTIFMTFENGKTSEPHGILLNPSDKVDLKIKDKYVASSNLSIYYTWKKIIIKNKKSHTKTVN